MNEFAFRHNNRKNDQVFDLLYLTPHLWITEDIGHPVLFQHLYAVITLKEASTNWRKLHELLQHSLPIKGETYQFNMFDEIDA